MSDSTPVVAEQLSLLRLEATLLDGKMKQIVDRLWQIRALSVTLWSGAVAIGLGVGTADKEVVAGILLLSGVFPFWFAWIDSSYQRWYRTFRAREEAIAGFIHDVDFHLPATNVPMSLIQSIRSESITFPIFDLYGRDTYGPNHPKMLWYTSRISNMADTTPLIVYGVQLATSTVLISVNIFPMMWWIPPGITAFLLIGLGGFGFLMKKRILASRSNPATVPPA